MTRLIPDDLRTTFLAVADVLIPESEGMPSASRAGAGGDILDHALSLRPDLKEDVFRGLRTATDKDPERAARDLYRDDPEAFGAIGLLASACYFMIPGVRELIGYPGQQKSSYDPHETPEYVSNGMLQVVIDRGPTYRPTPR